MTRTSETNEVEMSSIERADEVYRRDAIAHHERTIKRRWEINMLALVFCLIPVILSEILTYVARDSMDSLHKCEWLKATHICHEWREVALHSPWVWSNLCLMSNANCLKELIARSKDAPLYVMTGHHASRANLDLALGQLHRIYTLQLDLDI